MKYQHDQPQVKALRRLAVPNLAPVSGLPLIRSTPSLGRYPKWDKGRSVIPAGMTDEQRKRCVYQDFLKFVKWMEDEEDAQYLGEVRVSGPEPHFEPRPNDIQVGDRGASRETARNIEEDVQQESEFVDYVIECLFSFPERVTEIPTQLAVDIFGKGQRPDLRPLRERDFREVMQHGRN